MYWLNCGSCWAETSKQADQPAKDRRTGNNDLFTYLLLRIQKNFEALRRFEGGKVMNKIN
jgi:hypothetical protein